MKVPSVSSTSFALTSDGAVKPDPDAEGHRYAVAQDDDLVAGAIGGERFGVSIGPVTQRAGGYGGCGDRYRSGSRRGRDPGQE